MARVSGNLQRGMAAKRDFVADPVKMESPEPIDRVAQARQRATAGRGTAANSVAAAVGAGFVFGPVGALLAGWAVQQSQKKNNERLQAAAAALTENKVESLDIAQKNLETALSSATTDEDRAELTADLEAFKAYRVASFNPDPTVAGPAFGEALKISGALQELLDDQQGELIAREKLETDALNREEDQATTMRNRLESESRAYIDANRQFNNLKSLLDKDDISQVDATTAIFTYAKLVNPGEITTEGDVQVLSAGGGLSEQLAAKLNAVILGTAYMDETIAREMVESGKTLMRQQRQEQIERNMGAQAFAKDLGIREDVRRNISIPVSTNAADLVPVPLPKREVGTTKSGTVAGDVIRMIADPFIPEGGIESPAAIVQDQYDRSYTKWAVDRARNAISGVLPKND